jgi:hypothetical protein
MSSFTRLVVTACLAGTLWPALLVSGAQAMHCFSARRVCTEWKSVVRKDLTLEYYCNRWAHPRPCLAPPPEMSYVCTQNPEAVDAAPIYCADWRYFGLLKLKCCTKWCCD